MSSRTLFNAEEVVIEKAKALLENKANRNNPLIEDYHELYTDYIKIYKQMRMLVRMSDRQQQSLNMAYREVKQAKEVAETANRAKSIFLANMSHELRTPLNAIIGYAEMLMEDAEESSACPEFKSAHADFRAIYSAGCHLLGLITEILDLSKIEAGKMELNIETFEVNTLIDDILPTIRPLVEKNTNRLVLHFENTAQSPEEKKQVQKKKPVKNYILSESFTSPDSCLQDKAGSSKENACISIQDLGRMKSDMTKVRQIIFNLLSNSAKFTQNGTITLFVKRENKQETTGLGEDIEEECLIFTVSDTGIGMSKDELSRLFEPFTQADSSTTKKYGGTGLGLAITKRFVEMMGGKIDVQSQVNTGTTFTIRMPAAIDESNLFEVETA